VEPAHPLPVPLHLKRGIRFNRVTFRYPESDRAALQDFDLAIHPGQFTAIVGRNGSGKSTVVKLLCRFYDPQHGHIELDNIDIREFGIRELRARMSAMFQMPVHYNATVRENITCGDTRSVASDLEIEAAARAAGAGRMIAGLPDGYNTMLGRWFDRGTELSVGEWQRVALARALLRDVPILLLDEPTGSMDPWTEAEWLEQIRCHTEGRTVLLITHRMSTAMHADIIHVMEDGRIIESGAHNRLLAIKGRYAESWVGQMEACV